MICPVDPVVNREEGNRDVPQRKGLTTHDEPRLTSVS